MKNNKGKKVEAQPDPFDQIFEFKMMGGQFNREATKAEKKQKLAMEKIKIALQKGDQTSAKLLAQEALRYKGEVGRYRTLGSKISMIYSKLQQAYKTQQLNQSMRELVSKMTGMANLGDITKMMETMDTFEKMFDNIDVTDKMMNDVFDNIGVGTVNDQEVDKLINMMQESEGLRVGNNMIDPMTNAPGAQKVQNNVQNKVGLQQVGGGFFP